MKVLLFGATGMVGQGVLRESLLDPEVETVLAVGRGSTGQTDPKLRELVHADLFDYSAIEAELTGYDACFFCLGVSAAGMSEKDYRHITYDLTLAAAKTLARLNPKMTFIYVSGAGTNGTEKGGSMWARVKGETENAILALPFQSFMFRPGLILPMHGIKSKTALYRGIYTAGAPIWFLMRKLTPSLITTTEQVGLAMLKVAKSGAPVRVLEMKDQAAVLAS